LPLKKIIIHKNDELREKFGLGNAAKIIKLSFSALAYPINYIFQLKNLKLSKN
jgi:hypothetical protein